MASNEQAIASKLSVMKKATMMDDENDEAGSKERVFTAAGRKANGSVSSAGSSQLSASQKPPAKKAKDAKKHSTRTVDSGVSQITSRNRYSFNQRLRNMLEIFRCRLNSNSSGSSSTRRSSQQQPAAKNSHHRPSTTSNTQPIQVPANSAHTAALAHSPPPPPTTATTATTNSAATASQKNYTCCQLCINECSDTDLADGSSFMYPIATCDHSFCVNCLRLYLKYQIVESRVSISCPQCSEKMHPNDIYALLSLPVRHAESESGEVRPVLLATSTVLARTREEAAEQQRHWCQLIDKYEEFMLRRVLVTIPDVRYCPAPDCTYAVIASGCANCPQLTCQRENCNTSFCYHCKQYWHPNLTCEDAAIQNNQSTLSAVIASGAASGANFGKFGNSSTNIIRNFLQRSNSHISMTSLSAATTNGTSGTNGATLITSTSGRNQNLGVGGSSGVDSLIKDEIKRCPKCQALIVKMDDGSCNHITCAVCGCEFCWLCMKEISDLHYLSPSGCTFWGKKPWSRKKKILWQLGTLIGAPVGIALVAGVAVPAIIIGLPIWAGRKVYVRYKSIGKHKRNLIVFGTVVGTVIVAPFVAALAVGIGVPILLAYVYGVVPISLCRSGGCGVTTNNNGGVRFAFDDENTDTINFFQNSASQTAAASTSKASRSEKAAAAKTAAAGGALSTGAANSVTIPISAIDTRPTDSIVMSTASSGTDSSSNHATTALLGTGAQTASNKKSVSINTNNNLTSSSPTPVLVTITMAKKSSSAMAAARGAESSRKHKRKRSKNASKKTSRHASAAAAEADATSSKKTLKSRFACDASAQMTATASATIASVACGSVESTQETKSAAETGLSGVKESAAGVEIAGNILTNLATISKNKLTSSLNIPGSAGVNDLSSSSISGTASASSCHLLLDQSKDESAVNYADSVKGRQQQSASVDSSSSINKLCKISTDVDNVSAATTDAKKSKQSASKSRRAAQKSLKAQLNNPSIGEASIGAYTTSMSASENNLGNYEDEKSKRMLGHDHDEDNGFEDDADEDDNSESESDSDSDSDDSDDSDSDSGDDDDEDESSEDDEEDEGHGANKPYNEDLGDRDSASNRAIASGSLCKDYPLETCSVNLSIKNEPNLAEMDEVSKLVKSASQNARAGKSSNDTKSAITTFSAFSYTNTCPSINSANANDNVDTYSVSMKSEKSINPSVTALAGSIKDNQSVENLSSEYANAILPPSSSSNSTKNATNT